MTMDAEKQRIHDQWHKMVAARDVDGLMELYAEDSVIESSAVLVIEKDQSGTLRGKAALRSHFAAFFKIVGPKTDRDWYRLGPGFTDGKVLLWEYPSKSPQGDQLDVVESADIEDGLIAYHRVYWGWVGFKLLMAELNK